MVRRYRNSGPEKAAYRISRPNCLSRARIAVSKRPSFKPSAATRRSAGRDGSPMNDPESTTTINRPAPLRPLRILEYCTGETSWTNLERAAECLNAGLIIHASSFCLPSIARLVPLPSVILNLPSFNIPAFSSAFTSFCAARNDTPARFAASGAVKTPDWSRKKARRTLARFVLPMKVPKKSSVIEAHYPRTETSVNFGKSRLFCTLGYGPDGGECLVQGPHIVRTYVVGTLRSCEQFRRKCATLYVAIIRLLEVPEERLARNRYHHRQAEMLFQFRDM